MFVSIISASPRIGGNSEKALAVFRHKLTDMGVEAEVIRLRELRITPCQACDACAETGRCIIGDDMQLLYPKIQYSKGLVLLSPVYFGGLSAQMKAFIDRFQCWWHAKYRLDRPFIKPEHNYPGLFVCIGAHQGDEHCQNAAYSVKVFFRVINYQILDPLYLTGYDAPASLDPGALEKVARVGEAYGQKVLSKGVARG